MKILWMITEFRESRRRIEWLWFLFDGLTKQSCWMVFPTRTFWLLEFLGWSVEKFDYDFDSINFNFLVFFYLIHEPDSFVCSQCSFHSQIWCFFTQVNCRKIMNHNSTFSNKFTPSKLTLKRNKHQKKDDASDCWYSNLGKFYFWKFLGKQEWFKSTYFIKHQKRDDKRLHWANPQVVKEHDNQIESRNQKVELKILENFLKISPSNIVWQEIHDLPGGCVYQGSFAELQRFSVNHGTGSDSNFHSTA